MVISSPRALLSGVIAVHDRVLTIKLQTGARLAFLFFCSRTDVILLILVVLYSAPTAIRDCTLPTVDVAHCIIGRFCAAPAGQPKPYNELAWFWSDQGDLKLMIAGLAHSVDQWVVRGDPEARAFSTFGFRNGKLAVVESVNRAGDHAAAKQIIGTTKTLTPEEAADPAFDLWGLAKR
jgi:Reductase C-terminal